MNFADVNRANETGKARNELSLQSLRDTGLPASAHERLAQGPFSTSLSPGSVGLAYGVGLKPLGLVMGLAIISVGQTTSSGLDGREHAGIRDAVNLGRELALKRIRLEASMRKAAGVVDVALVVKNLSEEVLEVRCAGTAVEEPAMRSRITEPFLSTLSMADHWTLAQVGYAPREIVFGFCSWQQTPGFRTGNMKRLVNNEHPDFTRGLAAARNLAHLRLYEQARLAKGQGVVGIHPSQEITRSKEGMEFRVSFLGTAIAYDGNMAPNSNVTPSVLLH